MTAISSTGTARSRSFVDDPLKVNARGATATTTEDDWVRDLIRAVLFTRPGERVHRPDFGSGLAQLVFDPLSGELGTTVQFLVQGALQQWVGHLIEIEDLSVSVVDNEMTLNIAYTVRETGRKVVDEFKVGGL